MTLEVTCVFRLGPRLACSSSRFSRRAPRADEAAGVDFIKDAAVIPDRRRKGSSRCRRLDAAVIDKHCAETATRYAASPKYVTPATTFFASARLATLPTTVVYPFGGGDLRGRAGHFDAKEITTISPSTQVILRGPPRSTEARGGIASYRTRSRAAVAQRLTSENMPS
jgi:hypothetical protein